MRLDLEDAYVRTGREETLCSTRYDLLDAFVRIGKGDTLCSIRLDLLDAFVRIGRGETLCSIRLDLLRCLSKNWKRRDPLLHKIRSFKMPLSELEEERLSAP